MAWDITDWVPDPEPAEPFEPRSGFWRTHYGRLLRIREIATPHLKNIILMLSRKNIPVPAALELELEYRLQDAMDRERKNNEGNIQDLPSSPS